jgi:hypothetical protein
LDQARIKLLKEDKREIFQAFRLGSIFNSGVGRRAQDGAIPVVLARMADRWGYSDERSFHNVANRRDGCKIGTVFEVKKEIPGYTDRKPELRIL